GKAVAVDALEEAGKRLDAGGDALGGGAEIDVDHLDLTGLDLADAADARGIDRAVPAGASFGALHQLRERLPDVVRALAHHVLILQPDHDVAGSLRHEARLGGEPRAPPAVALDALVEERERAVDAQTGLGHTRLLRLGALRELDHGGLDEP